MSLWADQIQIDMPPHVDYRRKRSEGPMPHADWRRRMRQSRGTTPHMDWRRRWSGGATATSGWEEVERIRVGCFFNYYRKRHRLCRLLY